MKTRNTKQKEIIQKQIDKMSTMFFAEDLLKEVSKIDKKIGIATIYRFLKELRKNNLIHSYICDRKIIYSKNKKSHCHFKCIKSGKIFHFEVNNIDFLKNKIPGKIKSFQIEVEGEYKN